MSAAIHFEDLRSDWIFANEYLPRSIRKALLGGCACQFVGFPRHWIPLFEYWGVDWAESSPPRSYIPILSGMNEVEVREEVARCSELGLLRTLVEATARLDPLLSDLTYILDYSDLSPARVDTVRAGLSAARSVRITCWASYGRPEIREFESLAAQIRSPKRSALILPCARTRPYGNSRTHHRILSRVAELGFDCADFHKVVISGLGIIPEELWGDAVVRAYDCGVPDIYRILRLSRHFFSQSDYEFVLDALEFPPYSDVLNLLALEGAIQSLQPLPKKRRKGFEPQPCLA